MAEIERVIDTPLSELMPSEDERAAAEELSRQAQASPALARLAQVAAFVGPGRPATQAGNLKASDALALADRLGLDRDRPDRIGAMDDLADTAHAFRWAVAAGFLEWRGTKILAAPRAAEFDRDPLTAWLTAAVTLLEHGLLDGFRLGWRKSYVELLDANVGGLLVAMVEAGGRVDLDVIETAAWEQVATAYGYEPDDDAERAHVVGLARAMVAQLTELGALTRGGDQVQLSELGKTIAFMADLSAEFDDGELDLVDTDASSLLLVCVEEEEMGPDETTAHLRAWTQARPAEEAAAELCEAILDDDDPQVWGLGLEALGMLDAAVAVPAVRSLSSHPDLGHLAADWLSGHGRPSPRARRT